MFDLFFPPVCLGCEALVPVADPLLTLCGRCRLDVQPAANRDERCLATAVLSYDGPLRHALHRLKYQRRLGPARPLGRVLATAPRLSPTRFDFLVPVPLHPARQRERGFNQTALVLHAAVARWSSKDRRRVREGALVRRRATQTQADLPQAARATNVAGAFGVPSAIAGDLKGARVLVIDDVLTTGATLAACCSALAEAGAQPQALALLQSLA